MARCGRKEEFVVRYTNKEIMEKLEDIHCEIKKLCVEEAKTSSRVRLHSKILYFIGGAIMSIIAWIILSK